MYCMMEALFEVTTPTHQVYLLINQCALQAKCAVWNARSVKKRCKAASIIDFAISDKLDILAIVESWLTGDGRDTRLLSDLRNVFPDYEFHHVPRSTRGGGVGVLLQKGFHITVNNPNPLTSSEHMDITVSSNSSAVRLLTIYRSPPSESNELKHNEFFTEFATSLEMVSSLPTPVIIGGDFNGHMDVEDDHYAKKMKDLLDSSLLQQHVKVPTHRNGHLLDLLITGTGDSVISEVKVDSNLPSHHAAILCLLDISRPPAAKKIVKFRKLRNIQMDAFKPDIGSSSLISSPAEDAEALTIQFDNVMSELFDRQAP